ncbi:MAG: ion channel, partial [bacterium]
MNKKKILLWLGIILFMITATSVGYMLILDVSYIDALYMTIITISTVGYKEVADLNTFGKIYSMIVILISISLVGYILSTVFT